MSLSTDQVKNLLNVVAGASDDSLDCDGCFRDVAQFAETKLVGVTLCESTQLVQAHLENCLCCQDEFEALLTAIKETDGCSAERQMPPGI